MRDARRASRIRQQLARLRTERSRVEEVLLRRRRMLAASLIERHLGTRERKRRSSAFYVSWAHGGRTRLAYVPKGRVGRVRAQAEAWREYRAALRRWRALADTMAGLFRQLGEVQAEDPEELKS